MQRICKVLLLGDSISMGYRQLVKERLRKTCRIVFPDENGKFAAYTYRMLYEWNKNLEMEKGVDAIYWNNGLWDVVRIFGENPQTEIDIYTQYLERIYKRLRRLFPGAVICFATTTPVVEEKYSQDFVRYNKDICNYNKAAKEILKDKVDYFDDLYAFSSGFGNNIYQDATHFKEGFYKKLSEHICKKINVILDKKLKYSVEYLMNEIKDSNKLINSIEAERFNRPIVIWGAGNACRKSISVFRRFCRIVAIADRNKEKNGVDIYGLPCISPNEIKVYAETVIIAVQNKASQMAIAEQCSEWGMCYCTFDQLLPRLVLKCEEKVLESLSEDDFIDSDPDEQVTMKKYIGIDVPVSKCNLTCSYCYLNQTLHKQEIIPVYTHHTRYIRWCLSREKIQGSALIGLCGDGETLLANGFSELCIELLKEGHYLHIVTNGLYTEKIKEIIYKAEKYAKHILFKLSFHYLQLKERGLLKHFVDNVNLIKDSAASYTIELMPHDEIICKIPEIIEFSEKNFGALPQLTIGRDECDESRLLTELSDEEYYETWKIFDSEMFEIRQDMYMYKGENCFAGKSSFWIELDTGNIRRCVFPESVGNICDDRNRYEFKKVEDSCPLDYCFNCHIYATLGILPKSDVPPYLTIRDRIMDNGQHWIKEDMRRYLDVKLSNTKTE